MTALTQAQMSSRERTLLAAVLLSMWGPLATGMAVVLSHSTTQLADFIRRSVELVALTVSWWSFRYLGRRRELGDAERACLERTASLSVAAAMACSGAVMLAVAFSRLSIFVPGGNVTPGLAIAILGLITNVWFWRRYAVMTREHYSPIIAAQRQLYRAKAFVDLCVISALAAVAMAPTHSLTRYVDVLGSVAVAFYLLWSSLRVARAPAGGEPYLHESGTR
jgi:divalent metal cation (Fe/Co/Zn/Cd) transporter